MKFVKKNKLTMLIIVIFVVLVIIMSYLYNIFFGGSKAVYGNRLDGIAAVEISKKQFADAKAKLKEDGNVTGVEIELKGKIVNIIITVKDEASKEDAKNIGKSTLSLFEEEQLGYYDFQVFLTKEDATLNDFPIIGYKQNTKEGYSWTKDRQVTKDED